MTILRNTAAMLLLVGSLALGVMAQVGPTQMGAICNDGIQVVSATECGFHGGIHCILFSDGSCR